MITATASGTRARSVGWTSLFAVIQGTDASNRIIGAGVLRIDLRDLLRMLTPVAATNAATIVERADALHKVGRFFAGLLYERSAAR